MVFHSVLLLIISRNEALYLKEWIEHHRMMGFDSFILFNDQSTDSTQCILDAYVKEGVVILETEISTFGAVFDACVKRLTHLQQQQMLNGGKAQEIWIATHDTDEFIWFNRTNKTTSLKQVLQDMVQSREYPTQSLQIPRLQFGASGHELYEDKPVIERFTKRFNHEISVQKERQERLEKQRQQQQQRQLGPSIRDKRRHLAGALNGVDLPLHCAWESSYDFYKSMSLVSAVATECFNHNEKLGRKGKSRCLNTHNHLLKDKNNSSSVVPIRTRTFSKLRNHPELDARYMNQNEVGSKIVLAHYLTKSRFYQRICSSRWNVKYYKCPKCTPEIFFNTSQTCLNNDEDNRMHEFAILLRQRLSESSSIASHCDLEQEKQSWEFYHSCFLDQKNRINSS